MTISTQTTMNADCVIGGHRYSTEGVDTDKSIY
jgi:hypothetical protein